MAIMDSKIAFRFTAALSLYFAALSSLANAYTPDAPKLVQMVDQADRNLEKSEPRTDGEAEI